MKLFLYIIALLFLPLTGIAETFVVTSSYDQSDANPGDGICSSSGIADSSDCTLRAAIEEANLRNGADTIIVTSAISPLYITNGALIISDDSTCLFGDSTLTVIDGVFGSLGSDIFRIESDYNKLNGLTIRRAHRYGILILGSGNFIGSTDSSPGNVLIGCGLDFSIGAAIAIQGSSARSNQLVGNHIGIGTDGVTVEGNETGILIESSESNKIDGNLISGNILDGIRLSSGASGNIITDNLIGPDLSGLTGVGNGRDGILIESASNSNQIGSNRNTVRNVIGLNRRNGISINSSRGNLIIGNHIGIDDFGWTGIGNDSSGIVIRDGSAENVIGGNSDTTLNLISSNGSNGVIMRGIGTSRNILIGNYIGMDKDGIRMRGNGFAIGEFFPTGHGVLIDSGASQNTLGGDTDSLKNVISANFFAGVVITGSGTDNNKLIGNYIGVNAMGTSSSWNGNGVLISSGASNNVIGGSIPGERNIISGNRSDIFPMGNGILITGSGTSGNIVIGNYIGTDITGARALRNGTSGVMIANGASGNRIGGTSISERNVISGNGTGNFIPELARGIHLVGIGTSNNRITGNYIGVSPDGSSRVRNIGHGIGIFAGADGNFIGGETPEEGNLISLNEGHGIVINNSHSNLIRQNITRDNDSLAISVTVNAQEGIRPVTLLTASTAVVSGTSAPPFGTVDIYVVVPDLSGQGEGIRLVASGIADNSGNFTISTSTLEPGDILSAIATDKNNNSSAFARNIGVDQVTEVTSDGTSLPSVFSLHQNYPNPFNPTTTISFELPARSAIRLEIHNALGQIIRELIDGQIEAGRHSIIWDGRNSHGFPVASGVYLLRLSSGVNESTIKALLLR